MKNRHKKTSLLLLDSFSTEDISRWELRKDKFLRYHWDVYSALAYERNKIAEELRLSLQEAAVGPYQFSGWQRQVRYKYSLTPLSPKGSLFEPGGRFNIPNINLDLFQPFPALYIAQDKLTTLQEAGQQKGHLKKPSRKLTGLELALVRQDSISIVSVHGKLATIIDLCSPNNLRPFLNLIRGFSIPKHILQTAEKLKIDPPQAVRNLKILLQTLLEPNWRAMPMQFDVPANCQIFGQLVLYAGIEGILYPSKFTKKRCLAIFPQNFVSESFIAIDDAVPQGVVSRLDVSNVERFCVTA